MKPLGKYQQQPQLLLLLSQPQPHPLPQLLLQPQPPQPKSMMMSMIIQRPLLLLHPQNIMIPFLRAVDLIFASARRGGGLGLALHGVLS